MTATTRLDRALLGQLLRTQHSVIARDQALSCGMTNNALHYRTRPEGPWQTLLRGVYVTQSGTPTADQRDMAALLYAGRGSVITGRAALRRLGLRGPRTAAVDVLVPVGRKRRSSGFVRVLRTTRMPDLFCVDGQIRFVLAPRAVADTARGLTNLREVRAVVADSVQQGWCTLAQLVEELNSGPVAGSARFRQALAEVTDGIRSTAEADLCDLIKRAGLPLPVFNARLYAGTVLIAVADAWWPRERVAAEVDSREWHFSPEDWERTLRRHARMTAQGILVLHFTPRQIRSEPAQVVAAIRAALDTERAGDLRWMRTAP